MWAVAKYDPTFGNEHTVANDNPTYTDIVYVDYALTATTLRGNWRAQLHAAIDALCDSHPEIMEGGHFYEITIS